MQCAYECKLVSYLACALRSFAFFESVVCLKVLCSHLHVSPAFLRVFVPLFKHYILSHASVSFFIIIACVEMLESNSSLRQSKKRPSSKPKLKKVAKKPKVDQENGLQKQDNSSDRLKSPPMSNTSARTNPIFMPSLSATSQYYNEGNHRRIYPSQQQEPSSHSSAVVNPFPYAIAPSPSLQHSSDASSTSSGSNPSLTLLSHLSHPNAFQPPSLPSSSSSSSYVSSSPTSQMVNEIRNNLGTRGTYVRVFVCASLA